jgi:cysteinyl-tRNA synthetase
LSIFKEDRYLIIFDSVKRERVQFQPIREGEVKIYVCGPTVYDDAHLGHGRSGVAFDVLRRVLKANGYKVTFAKNFTDIDDKIINKMKSEKRTLKEITDRYMNSYLSDMEALNVERADIEPKATEYIDAMVSMVENLIGRDIAYRVSSGDVYFDTSKDKDYLSISQKFQDSEERVSRLDRVEDEKRNLNDFVLWKGSKDGDEVKFETAIGTGRPGWHIECSAMIEESLSYKDSAYSIDIHGGGADLLFPHHENEATQSRCSTDRELSKYWIHNGFVRIDGEKMSKSLGNSFFIKDALKHYSGELLRFYLLTTHYRQDFNFSEEELLNSKKRLDKLYRLKKRVYDSKAGEVNKSFKEELLKALNDDINLSVALSKIDEMINSSNEKLDNGEKKSKKSIVANINYIDEVLGFGGSDPFKYFQFGMSSEIVEKIEELLEQRKEAKKEKNFERADLIREEIESFGVQIMDTPNGAVWERV